MKVFITGAKGQLGKELEKVFGSEELYLSARPEEDITDSKIISRIIDFEPDLVLHSAAMTDVDACESRLDQAFHVNALGSLHVAVGAEKIGAKLVFVSTDYVFDGEKMSPYTEFDRIRPVSVYGRSKLAGEEMVRNICPRHFILRTSWLYGQHGRRHFIHTVLNQAASRPELSMVSDKIGTPTLASDLAKVVQQISTTELYGVYHASNYGETSWQKYAKEILQIRGIDKPVHAIKMHELERPAQRPSYSVLKNFNLEQIGIRMRPWQDALKDFLEHDYHIEG